VRLYVTDHAFIRMGDWHPDLKQFVPRSLMLDVPQAQGVLNALNIFVSGLEGGRPATCSEKWTRRHIRKYHRPPTFIFDRQLQDLYTFVVDPRGAVMVTFTTISDGHAVQMLDNPSPLFRFSQVDEIRVPYALGCALHDDPEFLSLRTPAGREIPISYDIDFTPNVGTAPGSSRPPLAERMANYRITRTR